MRAAQYGTHKSVYGGHMNDSTVGERVRGIRAQLDLSQQDVADHLGVRVATVSGWENDHAEPNAGYLRMLADLSPTPTATFHWLRTGREPQESGLSGMVADLDALPYTVEVPDDYTAFVALLERILQRSTMVGGLVAMMATDAERLDRPRAAAYLRATREAIELTTTLMSHARADLRNNVP